MNHFIKSGRHTISLLTVIFLSTFFSSINGASKTYTSSSMGPIGNGYHYELWTNGRGTITMTVYGEDAKFKADWNSVGDFVARVGLKYDEKQTHTQIGTFKADYAFTKTNVRDLMYAGVYGWSVDPLVEYYILEDWNAWRPTASNHTSKGTITVDGAEYEVFTKEQVGQPSIKGQSSNFTQFWSIRKNTRQSGQISITDHFNQWDKLGMKLGKMYEVKLKVEGMNGAGVIDFTKAIVTAGSTPVIKPLVPKTTSMQNCISGNGSRGTVSYLSLDGKILKSFRIDGSESSVPSASNLPCGSYVIQFKGDKNSRPVAEKRLTVK